MSFKLTFAGLSLSNISPRDGSPDFVIGPLQVWLGWDMQGLAWSNRFDLIIERTGYRPEGGQWFETCQDSPEERGGYVFGRKWCLLTGNRVMNG